jgi:uncharacterized protein DUF3108
MRALLIALAIAACTPALSTLPAAEGPQVPPIAVRELLLPVGERLVFDVRSNGVPIGRIEMTTGEWDVRSRFETSRLVSSLTTPVHHELTTFIERGAARPRAANELLERDGETTAIAAAFADGALTVDAIARRVPGGYNAQTLHTALAWLRAWANVDARPGFVFVEHLGQLYRLDVERPTVEDFHGVAALRIACRAGVYAGSAEPAELTVWLVAGPDRTPLRIAVARGPFEVVADLLQ